MTSDRATHVAHGSNFEIQSDHLFSGYHQEKMRIQTGIPARVKNIPNGTVNNGNHSQRWKRVIEAFSRLFFGEACILFFVCFVCCWDHHKARMKFESFTSRNFTQETWRSSQKRLDGTIMFCGLLLHYFVLKYKSRRTRNCFREFSPLLTSQGRDNLTVNWRLWKTKIEKTIALW